ncbi:DUF6204 family protein [Streptomyces sp. MMCC 100]
MSEQHTYRVIVRGTWDGLTEDARARLPAEATVTDLDTMKINRKSRTRR